MHNSTQSGPARIILASRSPYRKLQLAKLLDSFECQASDTDETALPGESASELVTRLALAKARHVAELHPAAIVIGSDQAATLDGLIFGKPGSLENARQQLRQCSGQSVVFETAVAIIHLAGQLRLQASVPTRVEFRELTEQEIVRYVEKDRPVDCAGSFKLEAAASSLFRSVRSDDPTALIGLPLIATSALLRQAGLKLP